MLGRRPITRPQTGKRRAQNAGQSYCSTHPDDPSCYYPGKGNSFIDPMTRRIVNSGCRRGIRAAQGNPPQCDFRKVTRANSARVGKLARVRYFFNRARIAYAKSITNLGKSPFLAHPDGWPMIQPLTPQQCANPSEALINYINGQIIEPLRIMGAQVWVNEHGDPYLKCGKFGLPELRWPPGMAVNNRYFQMGLGDAYTAKDNLIRAHNLIVQNRNDEKVLTGLTADEARTLDMAVSLYNRGQDDSMVEWRKILATLRPATSRNARPGVSIDDLMTTMVNSNTMAAREADLWLQIQEAAEAAALEE